MQKTISHFKVRRSSAGEYVPIELKDTMLTMSRESRDVNFETNSFLKEAGVKRQDSDVWHVVLAGWATSHAGRKSIEFDYTTGSAFRAVVANYADRTVPVVPSASQIIQSLASSVSLGQDMPRSDEEALRYLQSELGYEKADEAYRVMHAIRKEHDDVKKLLSANGVTVDEFVEWGKELEAFDMEKFRTVRGAVNLKIDLPVVGDKDTQQYRGSIHITIKTEKDGQDIDGNKLETYSTLSIVGSVSEKEPDHRWKAETSGQCVDKIQEVWSEYPEIMELCEIWEKWHLNSMQAGSRAQIEYLEQFPNLSYDEALEKLEAVDLVIDKSSGYKYGSKWLVSPLPDEVPEALTAIAEKSFEGKLLPVEASLKL